MTSEEYRLEPRYDPEGYIRLSLAIIKSAAADYMRALKAAKKNPKSRVARQNVATQEKFFHSAWYRVLTNVDGEYLIRRMKEAVDYED